MTAISMHYATHTAAVTTAISTHFASVTITVIAFTSDVEAKQLNQHAYKHGRYTAEEIARRREISALIRVARALG
jgi:hypothetical protein